MASNGGSEADDIDKEQDSVLQCRYCSKIFEGVGQNEENLRRHEQSCASNPAAPPKPTKHKRKAEESKVASHNIKKFFSSTPSHSPQSSGSSSVYSSQASSSDINTQSDLNELPELPEFSAETSLPEDITETNELPLSPLQTADLDTDIPIEIPTGDTSVSTVSISVAQRKCIGFVPALVGSVYENFPFQLLNSGPLSGIVFENGAFHCKNCLDNMYLLPVCSADTDDTHPDCRKLMEHEKLGNYITHACDAEKHLSTARNMYLTYTQLGRRIHHLQSSLKSSKLNSLNKERKLVRLHKSLDLHQRFMVLIKENSIPKLHELVKVACNRKRGLEYIITKMVNAIDGVYNARSGDDDKDLAFLILQYGGPGLLDIVHRALNFPSSSTAYRLLRSSGKFISSSVNADIDAYVDNIIVSPTAPKYGFMLKVDESYFEAKVRWNPQDNKLYGLCYEHGRFEDLTFESFDKIESLAKMVRDGDLHVPKENMVIATSNNSVESNAKVVAALPTCSKNEIEYQSQLIKGISNKFFRKNDAPFMNWSTDGDGTRRILFDELMSHDLSSLSPIFDTISKLPLMDTKVGQNDETVNFDHKHLVKRLRKCLINDNFKIGNRILLKSDMEKILALVPNNTEHSNKEMLNVGDKMNVPLATAFLFHFCDAVEDIEKLKTVNMRVSDVAEELHLLKFVLEGVLCAYTNPNTTIKEQLEKMSLAAHILFILQRELKTFMSNQLYHDMQATFMDAFYCAAKYKEYHPDLPLFIMLCANDVLERWFGNVRLKYKQSIVDNLELIFATRALQLCGEMMIKHPSWFAKNRNVMQRLCLDYSSPKEWNIDQLTLRDVDIVSTWNVGRASAEIKLGSCKCKSKCLCKYKSKCNFGAIASEGHTLLVPNGTKLGLNPREKDFSLDDVVESDDQSNAQPESASDDAEPLHGGDIEDVPATSLIDMIPLSQENHQKHDVQIEVDGRHVYKATVVKNLFSSQPLSRDRLRRVRGMTKYVESDHDGDPDLAIETSILAGDPLLVEVKGILRVAQIQLLKKANRKVKLIKAEEISQANVYVEALLMKMEMHEDFYFWSGEYGGKVTALGTACHAIQPSLKDIDGKMRFTFDKQFMMDLNVEMTLQAQKAGTSSHSSSVIVSDSPGSSAQSSPSQSSSSSPSSSQPSLAKTVGKGKEKPTNRREEQLKLLIPCLVPSCKAKVKLAQLRKHIGVHITKGTLSGCNVCGFCGGDACNNSLVPSTKNALNQFFKISSPCKYNSWIQRKPVYSTRNPCSNHLVQCPLCKVAIWTYNAKSHYDAVHPGAGYEDSQFVSPEERAAMAKLAKQSS